MAVFGTVLSPTPNTVFLTANNLVLGTEFDTAQGRFRFLKDHYLDGEFIQAGVIRDMFFPWTPTPDVEPLDATAVNSFYAKGPTLGAVIRTQFTTSDIYSPTTYWHQLSPNVWALTGLGASKAPITAAAVQRVEDKEA